MFLSQLLEEYKESDCKDDLFKEFKDRLWNSKYAFKKYNKYYTYKVNEQLLNTKQDLIDLFSQYSKVEYTVCKSFYKKKLDYIDYIRVHINNMYGFLIDKDVYFKSEYYKLKITPKKEYFRVINEIKKGNSVEIDKVRSNIENAMSQAEEVRAQSMEKKLNMKLSSYKKLINTYLERIFNNYIPVHEYEEKHGWELRVNVDGWHEDSYVVRYICRSLTGYLRNYIRDNKPKEVKKKGCASCGEELVKNSNRQKYCNNCWKVTRDDQNRQKSLRYYYRQK